MFGQRQSTSSSSRANVVPHAGQTTGNSNSVSAPVRRSATGPSTSGITSPALRRITMSPTSTPLRLTSSALCKVALSTVDPLTLTGSITANGVTRPVRPTFTRISSSRVVTSSGGYLKAMAHLGARLVEPRACCSAIRSIFTTTPSIS